MSDQLSLKRERDEQGNLLLDHGSEENLDAKRLKTEGNETLSDGGTAPVASDEVVESGKLGAAQPADCKPHVEEEAREAVTPIAIQSVTAPPAQSQAHDVVSHELGTSGEETLVAPHLSDIDGTENGSLLPPAVDSNSLPTSGPPVVAALSGEAPSNDAALIDAARSENASESVTLEPSDPTIVTASPGEAPAISAALVEVKHPEDSSLTSTVLDANSHEPTTSPIVAASHGEAPSIGAAVTETTHYENASLQNVVLDVKPNKPSDPIIVAASIGEPPSMTPDSTNMNRVDSSSLTPAVMDVKTHKPPDPSVVATISNPNSIVEERAEILAQYVGKVIGKGGEMLRDLQARSGCRLDVDQNVPHGNPRILTYRGTRRKVDLAKQMVATLCTPLGNETTLPLGAASRKDLMVPASSVGKIIGRSGEMVRELQSRSLAKIQVDHTAKAYKADTRLVSIVGTPDAVTKAEEMVLFLVSNPLMDAMKAIRMLVDDKTLRGGRWGSGPPYLNMPNHGYNMAPTESGFNQSFPPQQYGGYQQTGPPPAPVYGLVPSQPAYGGYVERGPETEYFPAAKMYMGRIIGQKGVTINDLQKRSGCDIQINQDVPAGHDCIITIKGARQNIEVAKQMLREIIEMGTNHPYAGGGGQFSGDNSQSYPQQGPSSHYMQQQAQNPMHGGYQQIGQQHVQQPYGGQLQSYGHTTPVVQQYNQPSVQYGMSPYQHNPVYAQHAAPSYGAPVQQPQPPPSMSLPVAFAWKSAAAADGQVYYYNEKTGETQWDKPAGMP